MGHLKTALVLEGGGIRSSYLAGVLCALHEKGLNNFDVVVGTSAGACCAANFVAGEPEKNRVILEDYLTGKRFIRFQYSLSTKNVMDIDYLVDQVCKKDVPINVDRVRASKSFFYITATNFKTGEPTYLNSREHDIHESLKASCAVPYLYRTRVYINGNRYVDGGMTVSIPVEKAIDEECKEIIVVSTREKGYRKMPAKAPLWLHRFFYPKSAMAQAFKNRHYHYDRSIDLIQNPPKGVTIHYIAPQSKLDISRVTRSKTKVQAAGRQGYADGLDFYRIYSQKPLSWISQNIENKTCATII